MIKTASRLLCVFVFVFFSTIPVSAQLFLPTMSGVIAKKPNSLSNNNALNFDGVNDQVVLTNDVKFQISAGTIEGWIKTGNAGSGYCGVFGKTFAYFLYLYVFYFLMLFLASIQKNKSIEIAIYSLVATVIQFYGYGKGFLLSFIKIQILKQQPEMAFPKLFFKK
jgi:hypothetical protein